MPSWSHPYHLFFALILGTYFFFGLSHLSQFITADEHYWVSERIPQYWNAIASHKWKKTFINDKPGVTLALVSGSGILISPDSEQHCKENKDKFQVCDTMATEPLYQSFRLPILLINGLLLILLCFLVGKLTDPWVALWTTMLTALSPILVGISQIVNPDSLLWSFGTTALFSFFALLRWREKKFLILTIFLTGFAILAKYTALILLPFYLALIVFRFFFNTRETPTLLQKYLRQDLLAWVGIVTGSLMLLCLFLPALLLDTKYLAAFVLIIPSKIPLALFASGLLTFLFVDTFLLKNTSLLTLRHLIMSRLSFFHSLVPSFFIILFIALILARNFFPSWSIFSVIPFDIKDLSDARYYTTIPNFFEAFLLQWNPLVFSLTPITLLGFVLLLFSLFQKRNNNYLFLINTILLLLVLYSVLLIMANVLTTPRYSILLYPLFAFLGALGYWQFSSHMKWGKELRGKYIITILLFLGSLLSLFSVKPFYFNYTNVFLPREALINDAWGYGGYEAAQYLNSLPDAKNLTAWADYYGVCEFFVGRCLTAYTFDPTIIKPDYYVLTRRGEIRYRSRAARWEEKSGLTAYKYYPLPNPDWQLLIDNRPGNFVKVFKVLK